MPQVKGHLMFLRVHDVGTGYGPPHDFLDAEVIVRVDSTPDQALGFQMRQDTNLPARQGMFELLLDAYRNRWLVTIDYDVPQGKTGGRIFRVWVNQ